MDYQFRVGDIIRIVKDNGEGVASTVGRSGIITTLGSTLSVNIVRNDEVTNNFNYKPASLMLEMDPERIKYCTIAMERWREDS